MLRQPRPSLPSALPPPVPTPNPGFLLLLTQPSTSVCGVDSSTSPFNCGWGKASAPHQPSPERNRNQLCYHHVLNFLFYLQSEMYFIAVWSDGTGVFLFHTHIAVKLSGDSRYVLYETMYYDQVGRTHVRVESIQRPRLQFLETQHRAVHVWCPFVKLYHTSGLVWCPHVKLYHT